MAWADRQRVPAEIPPGFDGEFVVVLEQTVDPAIVNYVNAVNVTVAVGSDTETAGFQSLRMTATADGSEAIEIELPGDGRPHHF